MIAVSTESIHMELLQTLAARSVPPGWSTPELARALGSSRQFLVARLGPLVSAGLVSRHSSGDGQTYSISDEGREYLRRYARA